MHEENAWLTVGQICTGACPCCVPAVLVCLLMSVKLVDTFTGSAARQICFNVGVDVS